MRWLTGFTLGEGEDKVAGHSGQFLVGPRTWSCSPTPGTRSRRAARRRTPGRRRRLRPAARVAGAARADGRPARRGRGRRSSRTRSGSASRRRRRTSSSSPSTAGSRRCGPSSTPDEIERIEAACAVADRALAALLPEIRPGVTEHDLALRLEWLIRTGGAEALAFDVACLAGPEAALPHGAPGDRPVLDGAVLLFDFGAQVEGYRSDMTRTLFVGRAAERDLAVYEIVAAAQAAVIDDARSSGPSRRSAAERPRDGRPRPRGDRRRRPVAGVRARPGPRDRPRDARGAAAWRPRRRRRCRAPRSSRWSPGSTSRARPASGSRTSSTSTRRAASSSASRTSRGT